jgi:D-alanyl-D-alanine carboxypeptidase
MIYFTRLGISVLVSFFVLSYSTSFLSAAPYAAMVIDARTGKVIHERNADTRLHPASLTKMMTLYVAFQAVENGEISLDDFVTISKNAANEPPSKLGLRHGQKIQLRYLIRAAAIKSANDAATAIGEAISGSEAAFAKRMTRTAKQLGMTKTTFKNAHGLTAKGHLSSARDMTTLGRHVFYDFPDYYNLFSRRTANVKIKSVNNTNRRLLDAYRGADGIKTGFTNAAGFNLVASAERGQKRIIATVFGGRSTKTRNARVAELLDMGFKKAPSVVSVRKPKKPKYVGNSGIVGAGVQGRLPPKTSLRPKLRPTTNNKDTISVLNDEEVLDNIVKIEPVLRPIVRPKQVPSIKKVKTKAPPNATRPVWKISLGLFNTKYVAEKELLKVALSESGTLKGTKRIVERTKLGFDATFHNINWNDAFRICEGLMARGKKCFVVQI